MGSTDYKKKYKLLKEKYERHEKIIIKAYESLKNKENKLIETNEDLEKKQTELEKINSELSSMNIKLSDQNSEIENKNEELTQTLEQLKETQSQLIQTEKMASLGILTSGIAHEINNPLNFIMASYMGLSEFFEETEYKNDENIKFFLNSLIEGVNRTTAIVNGLNEFSRDTDSNEEECHIHKILNNCLAITQHSIKHKVDIEKHFHESEIVIKGNSGKLHQVFLNILTNAEQSIETKGTIYITTNIDNKHVSINIKDTGKGISKKNLKRVTDPFFTTKAPGKGTGLGLTISYKIIKDHNGRIDFKSEPDKGTSVSVILPL